MLIYNFSRNSTEKGFYDITINYGLNGKDHCLCSLPSWRPGRYELQNFSKNVRDFSAMDEKGKPLLCIKKDKDTWEVQTTGVNKLTVKYSYFARQMDAGGSWLDDTQWYINFINCAMLVNNEFDMPCQVELHISNNWKIASSLLQLNTNTLKAANYYELVDSPLIASSDLQHITYKESSTEFHLWFQGNVDLDEKKILDHFRAFTDCQIKLFGSFPTDSYHFLFQVLPYDHYHGVEHAHSTVITLGPDYAFNSDKIYNDFLGVSSHELFHTWNITRLRPVEMVPYNFFKENYFNTGFIAEGITTYYGDYLLKRSGVFSIDQYLVELNKLLQRHFNNSGRNHASLAESSMDLWLDGYSKGIPGRKVSIYIKGALTALILDLTLRLESKKTLDDVMRKMWQLYGKSGYSYLQYQKVVNEVASKDMLEYFSQYIDGKVPLENKLEELLSKFGLHFKIKEAENAEERYFGVKLNFVQGKLKVVDLAENSPAMQHLEIGDEIIALNHTKPSRKYRELFNSADRVLIHYFSNELLCKATLKKNDERFYSVYEVELDKNAGENAQLLRKEWLGNLN